ncbi:hypothetical protein EDD18DRAFT_35918 [Armillaria luteobubalina]|uniref:Uncharacterized protein n=1 Tax=Armillaria luteobubalina TaxID=153913 RepID=A0AA39V0X2_9AGAR|nr:hypothetical protein EDD18DRAFT_35918 [Armillaria luteobubalina]
MGGNALAYMVLGKDVDWLPALFLVTEKGKYLVMAITICLSCRLCRNTRAMHHTKEQGTSKHIIEVVALAGIQKNLCQKYPCSLSCLPSRTCDTGALFDQYFFAVPTMLDAGQFPCTTGKTCPGEYSIILLRRPPTCRTSASWTEECEELCFAIHLSFRKQVRIKLHVFESSVSRFDVKGPVCCLSRSLLHEKVLHVRFILCFLNISTADIITITPAYEQCPHHLFVLSIPSTCAHYSKHATVTHALIRVPPPNRTKSFLHTTLS